MSNWPENKRRVKQQTFTSIWHWECLYNYISFSFVWCSFNLNFTYLTFETEIIKYKMDNHFWTFFLFNKHCSECFRLFLIDLSVIYVCVMEYRVILVSHTHVDHTVKDQCDDVHYSVIWSDYWCLVYSPTHTHTNTPL